jgi:hypothetical protein
MRKIATIRDAAADFRRIMLYDIGAQGVFLFLFRSLKDAPCDADYWHKTVAAVTILIGDG